MATQLWERIRAARNAADLTQAQVAKACEITRSAYAFYENPDPVARTTPNADQIQAIARVTKVPVAVLLDDKTEAADIWRVAALGLAAVDTGRAAEIKTEAASQRRRDVFWSATEYAVGAADAGYATGFEAPISDSLLQVVPDFLFGKVAVLLADTFDHRVARKLVGDLLMIERSARRALSKNIFVLSEDGDALLAKHLKADYGVTVHHVTTPEATAELLLSLR